jgi:hypothetical protein
VVAAVRVQLSRRHWLGAAVTSPAAVSRLRGKNDCQCGTHPGVTEPTLALVPRAKYRHASAAPLAGLINLHPLHSISLQFRRSPVRLAPTFPFHSFRRPQTAETVKDSGAPKDSRGRDAPHIGQDRHYGRATSSGQEIGNSTARLRPVQDIGSNREIGHFCTASISQAALQRTETAELTGKTRLV